MRVPGFRMTAAADGSSERAHAGFIDARDMHDAAGPQGGLEAQQMAQALALGAVLAAAPRDGLEDGPGAGARIGPQGGFGLGVERTGFDDDASANLGEQEARHAASLQHDPSGLNHFPCRSDHTRDQVLSLCMTSPNSSQVSPLKRDSWKAWTG